MAFSTLSSPSPSFVVRPASLFSLSLSLSLFLLVLLCQVCPSLCEDAASQHQQQQQQLHDRMNELVDGVHGAVHDADAAAGTGGDKRQVVDIGQSLTMLETKFNNLRAALANELGASKTKLDDHTATSKQLMERSTELVRTVIMQRDEMTKLTTDIRDLDSTLRMLKDGLHSFDAEMATLSDIVDHLHQSHSDLTESHADVKHQVKTVVSNTKNMKHPGPQRWLVAILIIEMLTAAAFLYVKRVARGGLSSFKSYGSKFG